MQSINLSDLKAALIRLSILCALVLLCVGARAESGGEAPVDGEAAEGAGSGQAAGEGGSGASGTSPGAEAKAGGEKADRSDFADYNRLNNKMSSLKVKVEEAHGKLVDLVAKKKMGVTAIKDEKGNSTPILELIVSTHKTLHEEHDKFNSNLTEITYRFPSKGQEIKRKYHPFRPKTIQQVERELGLSGQLSDLRNKVQEKYKAFNPAEPETEPMPKDPSQRSPASEEKPKRLTLKN